MITDPLFYRLFETSPETFFLLLGMSTDSATREEIKTMLQLHDIRESRAYQEAKEEGRQVGREEGRQEGIAHAILKLAAKQMPEEEIAETLEVDIESVQKVLNERDRKTPR
jgi:predicted transposase/invertase (TIGR01784 family)